MATLPLAQTLAAAIAVGPATDDRLEELLHVFQTANAEDRALRKRRVALYRPVRDAVERKLRRRGVFADITVESIPLVGASRSCVKISATWAANLRGDSVTLALRDPQTEKDVEAFVARMVRVVGAVEEGQ